MGISFLRPLLQSLCCNSPWNYAVFWKLKHQHEMVLVWEDGFYDNLKLRGPISSSPGDLYLENSNKTFSSTSGSCVHDGTFGEYPIGLAVTEMSRGTHVVGTGVVGEAAFIGDARWIYSDNILTDACNSALVPEYPEEWLLQFAVGIKTILLVPVIPHGVLQLGSVEMVAEDAVLAAYMRDKFEAHIKPDGHDWGYFTQQEPSIITTENVVDDQNDMTKDWNLITNNQMMVQDFCNSALRCVADNNTLESLTESNYRQQLFSSNILAEPCQLSYEDYKSFTTENDISKDFHEKTLSPSYWDNSTFVANDFDSAICESGGNLFSFHGDYELHKISGTAVEDNIYPYSMDLSGSVGVPRLLEAVVTNGSASYDDNSSNKSSITSSNMSLGKNFASSKKHVQSEHSASMDEYKVAWNILTHESIPPGINAARNLSASMPSVESEISILYDKHRKRKLSRLPTTKKRRAGTGNNRGSKPRDRQLIQERLKELRELVPKSEKCSIDGLLDKTIKHMLFLRNVTKQSDKLRHHKEESDEKTRRSAEVIRSRQNGTSWAVELGGEQQLCPIVVKDLDHPKHMLIEMLCTDHDRFLEIADVIHRLQLTILEGVMEKSSDNSWARFIVETTGSFHRLDIFWPLMQLLQQSRAPISSKI